LTFIFHFYLWLQILGRGVIEGIENKGKGRTKVEFSALVGLKCFAFAPRLAPRNNGNMKASLSKLKKIKLLALDVDGILTDCRTFMDGSGEWRRQFSIRDGYGIKMMVDSGYKVAFITGTKARDIQERRRNLNVHFFYEGFLDKLPAFETLLAESGFAAGEIAYMGDDIFDIPVLKKVGFSATVADAMDEVLDTAHYVTKRPAGNGAVREVCDMILKYGFLAKNKSR
jgi:3-deoxy-D-manno-octulosonate 8-phosphate phosphatase (KDO 8-P phosphatase)